MPWRFQKTAVWNGEARAECMMLSVPTLREEADPHPLASGLWRPYGIVGRDGESRQTRTLDDVVLVRDDAVLLCYNLFQVRNEPRNFL